MTGTLHPTSDARLWQLLLIASTLALSWLGMMVVHEFGHCLFAWLCGGSVSRVVLHPLQFSRTELAKNPHPLFVAWGGAIIGTLLPLVALAVSRLVRWKEWYTLQFFAGYCLVANGIYLGVVSLLENAADPGDMMREGTPQWVLVLFGLLAFPAGLYLWNGLGAHFGLGKANGSVNSKAAVATFLALIGLIVIEFVAYAG